MMKVPQKGKGKSAQARAVFTPTTPRTPRAKVYTQRIYDDFNYDETYPEDYGQFDIYGRAPAVQYDHKNKRPPGRGYPEGPAEKYYMIGPDETYTYEPDVYGPSYDISPSSDGSRRDREPKPDHMLLEDDANCTFTPDIASSKNPKYRLPSFEDRQSAYAARSAEKKRRLKEKRNDTDPGGNLRRNQSFSRPGKGPVGRSGGANLSDAQALGRSMHDSQVAHKAEVLEYVKKKHGLTANNEAIADAKACTFKPDLGRSRKSLEQVRSTFMGDPPEAGRDLVEEIKEHGRRHAGRREKGKTPAEEEVTFHPRVNPLKADMEYARSYLESDVFTRLTEGILYRQERMASDAAMIQQIRADNDDNEASKFADIIEARHGPREEEGPNWWRIQRFLWHQNLCEERRNLNREDIQRKIGGDIDPTPYLSNESRKLADKMMKEGRLHDGVPIEYAGRGSAATAQKMEALEKHLYRECNFRPYISNQARKCQRSFADLYNEAEIRRRRAIARDSISARKLDKECTFQPKISDFANTRKSKLNTRGHLGDYLAQLAKREEMLKKRRERDDAKQEELFKKVHTFQPNLLSKPGTMPAVCARALSTFRQYNAIQDEKQREKEAADKEIAEYQRKQFLMARGVIPNELRVQERGSHSQSPLGQRMDKGRSPEHMAALREDRHLGETEAKLAAKKTWVPHRGWMTPRSKARYELETSRNPTKVAAARKVLAETVAAHGMKPDEHARFLANSASPPRARLRGLRTRDQIVNAARGRRRMLSPEQQLSFDRTHRSVKTVRVASDSIRAAPDSVASMAEEPVPDFAVMKEKQELRKQRVEKVKKKMSMNISKFLRSSSQWSGKEDESVDEPSARSAGDSRMTEAHLVENNDVKTSNRSNTASRAGGATQLTTYPTLGLLAQADAVVKTSENKPRTSTSAHRVYDGSNGADADGDFIGRDDGSNNNNSANDVDTSGGMNKPRGTEGGSRKEPSRVAGGENRERSEVDFLYYPEPRVLSGAAINSRTTALSMTSNKAYKGTTRSEEPTPNASFSEAGRKKRMSHTETLNTTAGGAVTTTSSSSSSSREHSKSLVVDVAMEGSIEGDSGPGVRLKRQ
ncbi:unnamed protein product [Amoebophrya sp. A25]|nr:unnamed protein product [Amoebophrya sp. A25]|eukprot:GSA25T00010340001.1